LHSNSVYGCSQKEKVDKLLFWTSFNLEDLDIIATILGKHFVTKNLKKRSPYDQDFTIQKMIIVKSDWKCKNDLKTCWLIAIKVMIFAGHKNWWNTRAYKIISVVCLQQPRLILSNVRGKIMCNRKKWQLFVIFARIAKSFLFPSVILIIIFWLYLKP